MNSIVICPLPASRRSPNFTGEPPFLAHVSSSRLYRSSLPSCSSSCFPCVGVRLIYWSLRSTATFVICFDWSLLLAFSLHFSSSSAFLRSLFTQSWMWSFLFCGTLWNHLASLSRLFFIIFHSDHESSPFHPAIHDFANYTSFSSNFFSQAFHSSSLHSPYSGYFPYPSISGISPAYDHSRHGRQLHSFGHYDTALDFYYMRRLAIPLTSSVTSYIA